MKTQNPPLVGNNIKKIRKELSYTLGLLSEKSGVSKAMLSQIESQKVNPTVTTVWKIAQGLGVDINDLMTSSSEPHRKFSITRKETIPQLDTDADGLHISVLTPLSMADDLEMYLLHFKTKTIHESKAHIARTEEFITVLEGSIKVTVGENSTTLYKGDFISYHCDVEHSIENLNEGSSLIHLVVRFPKKKWDV